MLRKDKDLLELLHVLMGEFQERDLSSLVSRRMRVESAPGKITALIGMRRAGKSFLQFQLIQHYRKTLGLEQILYLNFEDERILPLNGKELGRLVDLFYSLFPENHHRPVCLFFDEIQNVSDWARTIRRIHDTKKAEIFITGSSAKLLSKEINTALRGRSLAYEVYPLSFTEWLDFKKIKTTLNSNIPSEKDNLQKELQQYLKSGGFPEVVFYSDQSRLETLQDYVNVVVLKDIVERHEIKNERIIRYLVKSLLSCSGKQTSINKIYNDLKSQGFKIGKDSLYDYMDHLEDAFFIFPVSIYSDSVRKQETNPKKIYSIDNGLTHSFLLPRAENMGNTFENQVFLDLRRTGYKIHYYKTHSGHEIDFIAQRGFELPLAFQVSIDPQASSEPKELQAEKELLHELNISLHHVSPKTYFSFLQTIVSD